MTRCPRLRLSLLPLETRCCPALTVSNVGGALLIAGTPDAGPAETLSVTHLGSEQYRVLDGAADLGAYIVSDAIELRLDSIDNHTVVDVTGDTIDGGLSIDLGDGDRDPTTTALIRLVGGGTGRIEGSAEVVGLANEEVVIFSGVTVAGDVSIEGAPVTELFEDRFVMNLGSVIEGNLSTTRVTYTLTSVGTTVAGDVNALGYDSPCGIAVAINGAVGGDVTTWGAATDPNCYSYVQVLGSVGGDLVATFAAGDGDVLHFGAIAGDARVTARGEHFTYQLFETGTVGGDARLSAGAQTNSYVAIAGAIDGSARIDLGGAAALESLFYFTGSIGRSLYLSGEAAVVDIGGDLGGTFAGRVGRIALIRLGDGSNTLRIDGAAGGSVGSVLVYSGGAGSDTVRITGQTDLRMVINTGGGDDTVAFDPDASVALAVVNFGRKRGTKVFVPPAVIDFPLIVLNLR